MLLHSVLFSWCYALVCSQYYCRPLCFKVLAYSFGKGGEGWNEYWVISVSASFSCNPCLVVIYKHFPMYLTFILFFQHVVFPWCYSCVQYMLGEFWTLSICSYFSDMFIIFHPKCMSVCPVYLKGQSLHLIWYTPLGLYMLVVLTFVCTWCCIMFLVLYATFH